MNIMNCRAVIFDLDGTLLDTLADIADSANRALIAHGFPDHQRSTYRQFVGDGSAILISRALPPNQRSDATIQSCLENFIRDYSHNWHQATKPYDGLARLLRELQNRNIRLAVVTNKPHRFAVSMVAHYFADCPFDPVLGQRDGVPKKPDPAQALAAAAKIGVEPSSCIFIGDSAVDMETACNAGMQPVGAGWGFRSAKELLDSGARAVIYRPMEMIELIDR
jgi:phosphoglycolate phosphatase